jgi:hypothetical protein
MKKLLLASVFAIASLPGYAHADSCADYNACFLEEGNKLDENGAPQCGHKPPQCKVDLDRAAACVRQSGSGDGTLHEPEEAAAFDRCMARKDRADNVEPDEVPLPGDRARVTVAPPYQGPPPIGWVYAPYTQCGDPPRCSMGVVSVAADGLNVRVTPNGPPVMALVNGTPVIPVGREGPWLLVAAGCDLTPTFAWSWTAGVPLNRCWVYF